MTDGRLALLRRAAAWPAAWADWRRKNWSRVRPEAADDADLEEGAAAGAAEVGRVVLPGDGLAHEHDLHVWDDTVRVGSDSKEGSTTRRGKGGVCGISSAGAGSAVGTN